MRSESLETRVSWPAHTWCQGHLTWLEGPARFWLNRSWVGERGQGQRRCGIEYEQMVRTCCTPRSWSKFLARLLRGLLAEGPHSALPPMSNGRDIRVGIQQAGGQVEAGDGLTRNRKRVNRGDLQAQERDITWGERGNAFSRLKIHFLLSNPQDWLQIHTGGNISLAISMVAVPIITGPGYT